MRQLDLYPHSSKVMQTPRDYRDAVWCKRLGAGLKSSKAGAWAMGHPGVLPGMNDELSIIVPHLCLAIR